MTATPQDIRARLQELVDRDDQKSRFYRRALTAYYPDSILALAERRIFVLGNDAGVAVFPVDSLELEAWKHVTRVVDGSEPDVPGFKVIGIDPVIAAGGNRAGLTVAEFKGELPEIRKALGIPEEDPTHRYGVAYDLRLQNGGSRKTVRTPCTSTRSWSGGLGPSPPNQDLP